MGLKDRLQHAWNAFTNKDPTLGDSIYDYGNTYRPDRVRLSRSNERSIATSVFNRIAMDVAAISIRHIKQDQNGRFINYIDSGLDRCFNLEANIDQTGTAFVHDIVLSMLDEGCIALVPVDIDIEPKGNGGFDIETMRAGKIIEWFPNHVLVDVYNDKLGYNQNIKVSKKNVGIIENPLYSVINESNSTLQRLIRKLALLDVVDNQSSSGKLDMLIQLPYVIKTEARRKEAEKRRTDIETQLAGSKYGIAYIDGTEKVTQLNRSLENNLMSQIEYLTNMLYSQLGITDAVLNGTADESTMLNYYNRTVEPIVLAICDECKRKFLTKTARSQGQTIMANRDPFRLLPLNNLAEIADKFTRNEILTSNEIRQLIGFRPADDKKADQLVNSNMPQPAEDQTRSEGADNTQQAGDISATQDELFNSTIDSLSKEVDTIIQNGDTVSHSDKSVNQSTQIFNESLELLEKSIDDIINKLGPRGDEDE
jgi:hypothetical protein